MDSPRTLETVENTCTILQALQENQSLGVTELAERLDMSKGGVYNHLATLQEQNYVIKKNGRYRLSYKFLDVGEEIKHQGPIYNAAKEEMEAISKKTDENAHLMVEEFGKGVNIHQTRGSKGVAKEFHRRKIGEPIYLHWNAPGKAILAHLGEERVEEIISNHGLPGKTNQTITNKAELFDELGEIRENGYALNDEEEIEGMRAIGSPIHQNEFIGAISISAPKSRIGDEEFYNTYPKIVMEASNVIEVSLATGDYRY